MGIPGDFRLKSGHFIQNQKGVQGRLWAHQNRIPSAYAYVNWGKLMVSPSAAKTCDSLVGAGSRVSKDFRAQWGLKLPKTQKPEVSQSWGFFQAKYPVQIQLHSEFKHSELNVGLRLPLALVGTCCEC